MNPTPLRSRLARLLRFTNPHRRRLRRPAVERLEGRALLAAAPQLIANLNDGPSWSWADEPRFASVGDLAYFVAGDGLTGRELWVTDGTASGTRLVKDLVPGVSGSDPTELVPYRGGLAFIARDASGDWKLWTTDGTAAGTQAIVSVARGDLILPDTFQLTVAGDTLFFCGTDMVREDAAYSTLWKSDGTVAGTARIGDFAINQLTAVGNRVFFTAFTSGPGSGELWKSDGTAAGTVLVADIRPGDQASYPRDLTAAGGKVFFTADNGVHGRELWVSDGTPDGTRMLVDIGSDEDADVTALTAFGSRVAFVAPGPEGPAVWISDGTFFGTRVLRAFPDYPSSPLHHRIGHLVDFAGLLVFTVDFGGETRLWHSNGTPQGTFYRYGFATAADVATSSTVELAVVGGRVLLVRADSHSLGYELSSYDPAANWAWPLGTLERYTEGWMGEAGGRLVLFEGSQDLGMVLRGSEEMNGPTSRLRAFSRGDASSSPPYGATRFVPLGDDLVFVADSGIYPNGGEPFRTDGTRAGTALLKDLPAYTNAAESGGLTPFAGRVFFTDYVSRIGSELWVTDGTVAGTHPFLDIRPGPEGSFPQPVAIVGGSLFFTANDGAHGPALWKTDGTPDGTALVRALMPEWSGSDLASFERPIVVGETLYFVTSDSEHGRELWKTDGTAEGTVMVLDIRPGPESTAFGFLAPVDGRLIFVADDGVHGRELWATDGTSDGTVLIADIKPGLADSSPRSHATIGGVLYFVARDNVHGLGLWRSDGTEAGTWLVADEAGGFAQEVFGLTATDDLLFFVGYDPSHGFELWASDGSSEGTRLIKDIRPGPAGYPGPSFESTAILDGILYFTAWDALHGRELWRSDGTEAGTWLVADIFPGVDGSQPTALTAHAGALYFTADDGRHGREPWVFVPDGPSPSPSRPAADLDGDRQGELVTYRPDTSEFFIRYASGRTQRIAFGPGSVYTGAEVPPVGVATDVDLDGRTDLTVYRPDTSEFFVRYADGRTERVAFGPGSAYTGAAVPPSPIVAALDFSGRAHMIVYRPDTSEFFVRDAGGRHERVVFGPGSAYTGASVPPVGLAAYLDDYGSVSLVVYRPDTSEFFIRHGDGRAERIGFGPGSLWTGADVPPVPSASDVDGDGRADLIVYRPDTSEFFVRYADGRTERVAFGPGSAYTGAAVPPLPVVNDLDGDGTAELVAYRPDTSEFFARYADGRAERIVFGPGSAYTGAAVPPSPLPTSVSAWSLLVPLDDDLLLAALGGLGPRGLRGALAGRGR